MVRVSNGVKVRECDILAKGATLRAEVKQTRMGCSRWQVIATQMAVVRRQRCWAEVETEKANVVSWIVDNIKELLTFEKEIEGRKDSKSSRTAGRGEANKHGGTAQMAGDSDTKRQWGQVRVGVQVSNRVRMRESDIPAKAATPWGEMKQTSMGCSRWQVIAMQTAVG